MPPGYEEKDADGTPFVIRVDKPIYGIPQSGRRLQRKLLPWFVDVAGLRQLDDSDGCVLVYDSPDGSETFALGVYVDNLQIVHSAKLDEHGKALDSNSFYAKFMTLLERDWDVLDEGPMEDLLAIEVKRLPGGAIKLHLEKYIHKLVKRFLPDGPLSRVQENSAPYSENFDV
eukprot:6921433-Prymnesium_polylepis.1